jgi:hypothetical protein
MQLSAEHEKGTSINYELGRVPALLKVRKVRRLGMPHAERENGEKNG